MGQLHEERRVGKAYQFRVWVRSAPALGAGNSTKRGDILRSYLETVYAYDVGQAVAQIREVEGFARARFIGRASLQ